MNPSRSPATTWQKWEGPIKTAIPILLSLFLTWHQMEKRLDLQAQQISQMQQQINSTALHLEMLESRIYNLVSALNRNSLAMENK